MRKRPGLLYITCYSALAVMLFGCASARAADPLRVSGEVLRALGQQFLATAALYDRLAAEQKIDAEAYARWAEFARGFRDFYPRATAAWKAAKAAQDQAAAHQILAVTHALSAELLELYAAGARHGGGP